MTQIVAGGTAVRNGMRHCNATGEVIYEEWTRGNPMAARYDTWRSNWCNKNRTDKSPDGFREGTINDETLTFAFEHGYKPEFTLPELVVILNATMEV